MKRRTSNPDFVSLVDRIELSDSWDSEKMLSLNLQERRLRSESWDIELFEIENKRRLAKKMQPFEDLQAWRDSGEDKDDETKSPKKENDQTEQLVDQKNDQEQENIPESDPMLFEAGKILSDQITMGLNNKRRRLAQIEPKE
jgi:carboxyl-terminal processing protease